MRGSVRRREGAPAGVVALTVVLGAVDVLPRWPGLLHHVALPPLGLLADLRVLVTRAPSYPVFVGGVVLAVAIRSAVLAAMLGGLSRERLALAGGLYGAATLPAVVAGGLQFSAAAALYHWYFWSGLGVALLTFFVLASAAWTGSVRLGAALARSLSRGLRAGTLAGYLLALGLLGWGAAAGGPAAGVGLVPVSAGLTVVTVRRLRREPARRPFLRLGLAAGAGVLAAVLLVGRARSRRLPPRRPAARARCSWSPGWTRPRGWAPLSPGPGPPRVLLRGDLLLLLRRARVRRPPG